MAKNMSLSGSEVSHLVIPTEGGGICLMSNGEYRTEMDLFDLMKKDIYKKSRLTFSPSLHQIRVMFKESQKPVKSKPGVLIDR